MSDRYRILITADSVCDLPGELTQQLPIAIMPYYVITGKGRFVDGVEIKAKELMEYLSAEDSTAKSESPSVSDYQSFFNEKLGQAEWIIHISMGRRSSRSYERAREASKDLPRVAVFDSGQVSSGIGLIVRKAAQLAQQGKGHEEICEAIGEYSRLISSNVVVRDTGLMDKSGRISHLGKEIADKMLLYPRVEMKKSRLHISGILAGRWEKVLLAHVRKALRRSWSIDPEVLIITHVGMDAQTLEQIRREAETYVRFKQIYVIEASAAIGVNCGEAVGIIFARKGKKKKGQEKRQEDLYKRFELGMNRVISFIADEKLPIKHRIMNLVLTAALLGGIFSGFASLSLGATASALIVFALVLVVAGCLYLSISWKKPTLAGVLICFLANMVIFPVMYFASGGLKSGMPIWFVLGLLFDWYILSGWVCVAMFSANLAMMIGCISFGERFPQYVYPVTRHYTQNDVIQTLVFVVFILGIIYKYQTYVYERQRRQIQEHEEELIRSNGAKDLFLANMSHEIRTPINGIMGMNTMLLRECGENANLKEYARNIQSSSQTLLTLVNDILDMSKIGAGKFEITPVEYDVFSAVNDCYQIAHARSLAKGLEFELDLNPALPSRLYGDEVRLRQIINNLLSNAVKYTQRGYVRLSIDMDRLGDAVVVLVISVRDTGIGIREEDKEKIFDSFARVDERKNRHIEGTGLGLNLTKNLVSLMKGAIYVDSVYGSGSTFTVRLPQQIRDRHPVGDFAKKYKTRMAQRTMENDSLQTVGACALVVDDAPMNLLVAKGLLQYTGMEVDTADSGQQALSMVCNKTYDIIFMDHVMPQMDGVTCLHKMKELNHNLNVRTPVIALTANALSGIREEYIRTGFHDYLSKPIREKDLYRILRTYLPLGKLVEEPGGRSLQDRSLMAIGMASGTAQSAVDKPDAVRAKATTEAENTKEEQKEDGASARPEESGTTSGNVKRKKLGARSGSDEKSRPGVTETKASDVGLEGIAPKESDTRTESAEQTNSGAAQEEPEAASGIAVVSRDVKAVDPAAVELSMEKLNAINGLDTACGMKYCMSNEQFYFMVLREYLKSEKSEIMDAALAKGDFEQYRIQVHAMKSTSLNIGAKELSEEAKASELACKEGDYETVRSRHEALMEQYRSLYAQLIS